MFREQTKSKPTNKYFLLKYHVGSNVSGSLLSHRGLFDKKRPISFNFLRNFGDLSSELDIWMLDRSIKNDNRLRQLIEHINKLAQKIVRS